MAMIKEGKAIIQPANETAISRKMEVFYNPAMKLNRDLTMDLLNSVANKSMQIADPLAGSGIRAIRMLLELRKGKIKSIDANDHSQSAVAAMKKNLKLNKIKSSKIKTHCKDANIFILESSGFDYIDIDPFGSPARFLDAACQRIARNGILAVTATDTAALAGTSPSACARKYWSTPLRNDFMHETGLRILIRRVQLAGMQYEKAMIPIFSYHDQHYLRAFFRAEKGREKASAIYKKHGCISYCPKCLNTVTGTIAKCNACKGKAQIAGPLWLGKTSDAKLLGKMGKKSIHAGLLETIRKEAKIDSGWFYNINTACKKYRIKRPAPIDSVIRDLRRKGYMAERTHFDWAAVKTDANPEEISRAAKSKDL